MKFTDFNLNSQLNQAIDSVGYENATPVQTLAIPIILEGKDLVACAQTGTGKTAAYLLPTLNRLMERESNKTRVLILAPTRELAIQIEQNAEVLTYFSDIATAPIYGGKDSSNWDEQRRAINNGADILVATPGRLITHMALGYVDFSQLEVLILDEADKMLDMGFYPDIMNIASSLPETRQTLMFSATMPPKIRELAQKILKDPESISLSISKPAAGIKQQAFTVYDEQKIPLIEHLLKEREVDSMIIFASSKISVDRITRQLKKLNYPVESLHSDKSQEERQEALRAFQNRTYRILVGTDVLSRGIDVDNLSHVLNYDVPSDAEDYVHRVGRTARASATGEAITFINPDDMRKFAGIERLIEQEVPKLPAPEHLGETPEYDPRRGKTGWSGKGSGGGGGSRGGNSGGRSGGGDRGGRSGGGDRGGRSDGGNRSGGSRGPSRYGSQDSRPPRTEGSTENRPPRTEGTAENRPPRAEKPFDPTLNTGAQPPVQDGPPRKRKKKRRGPRGPKPGGENTPPQA